MYTLAAFHSAALHVVHSYLSSNMRPSALLKVFLLLPCCWLSDAQFSQTPCPLVAADYGDLRPSEVTRIQAACNRSLPKLAEQKAFCSSCMCATSVAIGASVDRTGKVIAGTNYSTIMASIPTNPMLAANSGLSNCGELTSQVLQGSGALDAATDKALTDCQQLDPLFLLNVYKGCDFSVKADPALADNSPLTRVVTSGVLPAGVVRAGQDAASGVGNAVDGARDAVNNVGNGARDAAKAVGDGARDAAQRVGDAGQRAVDAVQGAWGNLRRAFNIRG